MLFNFVCPSGAKGFVEMIIHKVNCSVGAAHMVDDNGDNNWINP